ncbi:hypothetical protein EST38_g7095 [Candolleomyces aberdarensis]|uniref:F-box domain-containing protein n=1 Tax=Candolleomyces aberdarensis TaxID=2316362 RepID=A0A4Q2DG09_9AGAR|nr:hypothetical protein EST38_g7095 [Candolleomyces aberdarensis]
MSENWNLQLALLQFSFISACGTSNKYHDYFGIKPHAETLLSRDHDTEEALFNRASSFAPIDELPNEILAHIVELAYFSEELPYDELRLAVSHTSSRFRQITLTTPSLWSKYHLTQGNVHDYLDHLPKYLHLSKGYPLDLHFSCFWPESLSQRLMDLFLPLSHRWRHLSITTPNADIFSYLVDVSAPILTTVSLSHFSSQRRHVLDYHAFGGLLPSLTHLLLRNISLDRLNIPLRNLTKLEIRGYGTWPRFSTLEELLSGSETLEEMVFHVKPGLVLRDVNREPGQAPIHLPALRSFTVYTSEWLTGDVVELIRTFDFPNLHSLVVHEGSGLGFIDSRDILRYTSSPVPSMAVSYAAISTALRCLAPRQLETLNTLELLRPTWTNYSSLREVFRSMESLQKLVVSEFNPHTALADLDIIRDSILLEASGVEFAYPLISSSSLRTLEIDLIQDHRPSTADLLLFIRLFSLRSLSSLILRHLSKEDWNDVLSSFATHVDDYPSLKLLTAGDMHEFGLESADGSAPGSSAQSVLTSGA